jgi:hypothetical protein
MASLPHRTHAIDHRFHPPPRPVSVRAHPAATEPGVPRLYDDGNAAQLWRPTSRWRPGEVVRLRYPAIAFTPGNRLGVGVQLGSDPAAPRLPIDAGDLPALDGGRVALLGRLP